MEHSGYSSNSNAPATAALENPDHDESLRKYLESEGALINVVSGTRPCGLRGLFATRAFEADEMTCWVPNETVIDNNTCDPSLRKIIGDVLAEAVLPQVERDVYERMMCLSAGLLFEKARGASSRFLHYIQSLPKPPPTMNTFTENEQKVLTLMSSGGDLVAMYKPLVQLNLKVVRGAVDAGLWGESPVPSEKDIEVAFHFVLSRMSYMRMIPWVDLANAALPGEENAVIRVDGQLHNGREGCAVVAKRPISEGEEVLIDYNHHHAIGMLTHYGCTLGLESTRSVTTLQFSIPPWLMELGGAAYARGAQLQESESTGLSEGALVVLRMASMGGVQEVIEAAQAGYFKDPPSPAPTPEKQKKWDEAHRSLYLDVARFCAERRAHWEEKIGSVIDRDITLDTMVSDVIKKQYDTELRLLRKCEEALLAKALVIQNSVA